ncbi:MAG TPA: hypothetical protein VLI45_09830, partial [Acidobacteriaceae bacterium]|nr:hypothetical protein [Acidobacteriaceae bacterium]
LPEMLRIKAELLLAGAEPDRSLAEDVLQDSLTLARQQAAPAWELRTATSLAGLWMQQGRDDAARALLAPVYDRFTEGFGSPRLKAARELLDTLGSRTSRIP